MLEIPKLNTEDFFQRELLDSKSLDNFESVKEIEDLAENLKDDIQLIRQDAMSSGLMYGCIRTLKLILLDEDEIIRLGKLFFVKEVTPSIPVFQVYLRDLQKLPTLPNDKNILEATVIIEKILTELISEFGEE